MAFAITGFQDRRLQPLGHPSDFVDTGVCEKYRLGGEIVKPRRGELGRLSQCGGHSVGDHRRHADA